MKQEHFSAFACNKMTKKITISNQNCANQRGKKLINRLLVFSRITPDLGLQTVFECMRFQQCHFRCLNGMVPYTTQI